MTKTLADRLAASSSGSLDLWMTVEGPYGGSLDTEQFHEILLVAGGAGISHIMSREFLSILLRLSVFSHCSLFSAVLAQILHQARNSYGRATRVKVVWTVQNIEQSIWTLSELLNSAKTAWEAGVWLEIELYVSRGMKTPSPQAVDLLAKELPPPPTLEVRRSSMASEEWNNMRKESPIADALNILGGRPALDRIVPSFVAAAEGKSLVVGEFFFSLADPSFESMLTSMLSSSLRSWIDGFSSTIRSDKTHRSLSRFARDRPLRMLNTISRPFTYILIDNHASHPIL